MLLLITASACSTPGNPAPFVDERASVGTLRGTWECRVSNTLEFNTGNIETVRVGETLLIDSDQILGDPMGSSLRPDLESALGFGLDWYSNNVDHRGADFFFGYDRRGRPAFLGSQRIADRILVGWRLVLVDHDTLRGFQGTVIQDTECTTARRYVVHLEFKRVSPTPIMDAEFTSLGGVVRRILFVEE